MKTTSNRNFDPESERRYSWKKCCETKRKAALQPVITPHPYLRHQAKLEVATARHLSPSSGIMTPGHPLIPGIAPNGTDLYVSDANLALLFSHSFGRDLIVGE